MSEKLPFMNAHGLVCKILDRIIESQTPPKYTVDFQSTVIGHGSGSARPFIALLKKLDFIQTDGTPTGLYKKFRNSSSQGEAMAAAIKKGYQPLFKINEYADRLETPKLKEAIIQVTGLEKHNKIVGAIAATFKALKKYADFSAVKSENDMPIEQHTPEINLSNSTPEQFGQQSDRIRSDRGRSMNLSYTINLNLPASKDPEVFDAIFKSLKNNLLKDYF